MLKLCAFADEISPDLDDQIRVCRACGISGIELRSVGGVNVLDLDRAQRMRIRSDLEAAGIAVPCIGSPIGKVSIAQPWEAHLDRFRIAVDAADFFGASMIRIFSYYPGSAADEIRAHREEVLRRMRNKVEYLGDRPITLVHENEHAIYGERGRDCLDLMQAVNSPRFRSAFDFANFILDGERPSDNWPALKPYTAHFHIKDARRADRTIVPAGDGDGTIGSILADAYASGYRGFLSLEPHLSAAGQFSGFTGPELFAKAVEALRRVCCDAGVPLEGG